MTTDQASAPGQDAVSPSKTAAAAPDLGSVRALLVHHDRDELDLVASFLDQAAYDVVRLEDPAGIAQGLADDPIDIVIVAASDDAGAAIVDLRRDRRYADVPIILIAENADTSVPAGTDEVLYEPVEAGSLVGHVRSAVRTRRSLLGMEQAHAVVASLANELLAPETDVRLHTERLGAYAMQLGRRVGLSASDLNAVAYGTLLHDLAKLGIAEWILLKPGPFTDEERVAMQRHTEIGERIATPLAGAERFGPILRHHHERWDGKGYPDGLAGEAIPMGARIIGVVDAFDAMTQYRIYRESLSPSDAVKELQAAAGTQFDPELVDAFIEVLARDGVI